MNTNQLYYDRPAERWKECIPLGNGRMGAMPYGTVSEERIALNEDTIWASPAKDYHNPKALEALPKIRQLLFEGKLDDAENLARECCVSIPRKFGGYLPFGDLMITESDATRAGEGVMPKYYTYKNYKRILDMKQGIMTVDYDKQGVHFHREYFASYKDQVIVIRYEKSGEPNLDYLLKFMQGADTKNVCSATDPEILYYEDQVENDGVKYCGAIKVVADTGISKNNKIISDRGGLPVFLLVSKTNVFTIYLAMTTNYRGRDEKACFDLVTKAAQKGYERVKEDHIKDYQSQYNAFKLELDSDEIDESLTTLEWLDEVRNGKYTTKFAELHMNFTRYMLISSSRKGSLPSNMQGVWNELKTPTWESDYHPNINMEMNYWPAQAWGLSDSEEALVSWIEYMVQPGSLSVKRNYDCKGWTVHHCTNADGYAEPNYDNVGMWPMGSAWLSRHLFEVWQYNRDYDQMRNRFYPIIRGSIEFLLDFLVKAPQNSYCPGKYVTCPSVSPENEYLLPNGEHGMMTYMPTMDIQLIKDLFGNTFELIEEIKAREPEFEEPFVDKMREVLENIPQMQIAKNGCLQEWIYDYEEFDPGHRHISHLFGVYPGYSITPEETPKLAVAAKRSVERKYEVGYDGQGWSMGWQACVLARLCECERAYDILIDDFRRHMLPNLMINSHGIPQVGDAYGIPSTILELLVQSHCGKIRLLPALPKAWGSGKVYGLRVRGNHSIDMEWKDGKLVWAKIIHGAQAKAMPIIIPDSNAYSIIVGDNYTEIKPI